MNESIVASGHLDAQRINAYVDGELGADDTQQLQRHLATCNPCSLRVLSAMQLKAATARSAHRFTASPAALNRLAAQLGSKEAKKSAPRNLLRSFAWIAVAASLIISVATIGWLQVRKANALSAELLDQHLATLSSAASPEVLSTDRHTVKPWFQGKLPFSFNLPDALPADTSLKGANLTYLNGQPAALLLFTVHKHQVSVFLTQRSNSIAVPTLAGIRSGFAIHYATTPGLRIAAVSDVNSVDLDQLLLALVQAQSPE